MQNDGLPEFYVANQGFTSNDFYINANGQMSVVTNRPMLNHTGQSAGCSWGDIDNDGDLDIVMTDNQGPDRIFRNDYPLVEELILDAGAATRSSGSAWGDIDNDGDLDLFIVRSEEEDVLYLNEGDGTFTAVSMGSAADGLDVAATLVDDDEDGDLDLFVTFGLYNLAQRNRLYRNTTDGARNWLQVDLRRSSGGNRFGIGAHVYAYATIDGEPRTLLRPVETRSGHAAQNGNRVHFGLGDAVVVDSLVVDWPRGVGEDRTVLYDVAVNQIITVTGAAAGDAVAEARAEASTTAPASFTVEGVYPNPSYRDFTVSVRAAGDGPVRVEVLDVLGRRVRVLEAEGTEGAPVLVYWDGADAAGRPVAGGPYVLRVRQGADEEVVKVTLLR